MKQTIDLMQENFSVLPTTTEKTMTPYLSTNFLRLSSFYCESVFYKGKSNHVKSMLTRNILGSSACTGTTKEKQKPNNKSHLINLELHCWSF